MEMPGQTKPQMGSLSHTPESVDAWAAELAGRLWLPAHCRRAGAIQRTARVYVDQVPASDYLSGTLQYLG